MRKKECFGIFSPWSIVHGSWLMVYGLIVFLLLSCNSTYTSKKRGYAAIQLPPKAYQSFNRPGYPYSFEYPVYAAIIQDTTYFDTNPENPYWINIDFPAFHARIFLSYKIIGGKAIYKVKTADGAYQDSIGTNEFYRMVNDAFNLTNKNQAVASSIKDSLIYTPNGIKGVYFRVGGNAATARQFFLSDTTKHFLRGALYFNTTPNADSIKPVQDFIEMDIQHLLQTFRWVDKKAD